jgi:O-methyltransferase domain/Dimerisation domain
MATANVSGAVDPRFCTKQVGALAPDRILQIAFAFRSAKTLLTAVELGVFAALNEEPLTTDELVTKLELHGRGAGDFFDALVALRLLDRDESGRYFNSPDCALYLDPCAPSYIGGVLDYLNVRIYDCWGHLGEALRTGKPQAGPSAAGGYESFYSDATNSGTFLSGMSAGSLIPARGLAGSFPWKDYRTIMDIGTAQGCVPVEIATKHPHLTGGGFDLPAVEPSFTRYVSRHGLQERLKFHGGNFFNDPLPAADVLIMGRILHNWDMDRQKMLLAKAFAALPHKGALIVYETIIDDARRDRVHSLLASLNMLLQTDGGSEFTAAECTGWMKETGFSSTFVLPLGPFYSAVVGMK